jgi:CheY-like chemotaxis protein
MIGMLLRRALKAHDVTVLSNAKDARLQSVRALVMTQIFCDLNMPVMSDIELFENLSRQFPGRARALIFLSGEAHTRETLSFPDTLTNVHPDRRFDATNLRERVDAHLTAGTAGTHPSEAA